MQLPGELIHSHMALDLLKLPYFPKYSRENCCYYYAEYIPPRNLDLEDFSVTKVPTD
jgi:hypothetical protein